VLASVAASDMTQPLVRVADVVRHFGRRQEIVRAVDGVSLDIQRGETLSLVGETGCGKSTLARCIMRLVDVTSGRIEFDGRDITQLSREAMRPVRRRMQMVFQDPYGSLNPRHSVGTSILEPLVIHGIGDAEARTRRLHELMELVGMSPEHHTRFPSEFSGGQRQRISIARAIALNPDLLVCDEPVSALDVSIRAQIINLLRDLQTRLGLTYLFISHDLSVVRYISDRVAVMNKGKIVEVGPVSDVFTAPRDPYTQALVAAMPLMDPDMADDRKDAAAPLR
jgi:ABC-type oligopeptide transport system ATPase subunit